MNTIKINDVEYVSTRDIERAYGLSRNKCWKILQSLDELEFITIVRLRYYPVTLIEAKFSSL
ncbi:hypothetical protein [Hymenobacter fodinae]|uniref:Uncharacterized protein n=1 Tax=Hymenobacter fodinae TaxID=2510796 RepID=A0A4Z0P484_9BACT|nr:hypothetical protein [Hymenobacter fodinae]TGE06101.1 hypothetical protein EU556_14635 [Hymenobacter fodinae]